MKVTMLNDGAFLGGEGWSPGDQLDRAPKHVQPLLDIGAALEGHHDITEGAARLMREHGLGVSDVEGTGVGGRILVSDVRSVLEPESEDEDESEEDAS